MPTPVSEQPAPFFAPSEEAEFAEFPNTEADATYFVVEDRDAGRLVGCGGVFLRGDEAGFRWGGSSTCFSP